MTIVRRGIMSKMSNGLTEMFGLEKADKIGPELLNKVLKLLKEEGFGNDGDDVWEFLAIVQLQALREYYATGPVLKTIVDCVISEYSKGDEGFVGDDTQALWNETVDEVCEFLAATKVKD
jgi:hypothetical protein